MGCSKQREKRSLKPRYAVFTEGKVTEKKYLELLSRELHVSFVIKPIGGVPSKVFKAYQKEKRRGDFDRAILIIDVDQHPKLDEVLLECRSFTSIDAVVTNPCFELWLIWHKTDLRKYVSTKECQHIANSEGIADKKNLTRTFPISDYNTAIKRAKAAWAGCEPNKIGPNPSSAMPWFIDLLTTPAKKR